ncbi:8-oxo-dGTP diphosphatase [Pseudomonas delhiensis]|uniref:8-oxo-dGTP diphosphatase n=1 Tax=Pseudomonas delhiensis TaxID=366289 RepID=A0A239MS42_9PSED|nr:NUDIX hydrolase [Pseudomonas delhiensis]SDH98835.1 8-oxo-dGTP diphosphatase [Pseudomonas delhiensis]SNT44669.1 8-oxo-dGTP diphosphatase [Pseudomonas delhiensis]
MNDESAFTGAKLALFHDGHLVVYRRDEKPGIPFPGCWDFPGGGREGAETPAECALRELEEEFSIRLGRERIEWQRRYRATHGPAPWAWFLVARLRAAEFAAIRFGDEGQYWRLMAVEEYLGLDHNEAVPYLQERLRHYLEDHPPFSLGTGVPADGG